MPDMKCTGEKCPIPELTKGATACTARDCKHRTPPMPNIKEKLVELIDDYTDQVSLEDFRKVEFSEDMADHLISSGVTIVESNHRAVESDPTNADRIRAMSDEELAAAISVLMENDICLNPRANGCDGCVFSAFCFDCIEGQELEWLKQPAEEG